MTADVETTTREGRSSAGPLWVIAALMVLAALHLGRDVFIPMALALLLSVVLVPPARALQRLGLPRPLAVLLLLIVALGVIAGGALLVTSQVLNLAADLSNWEASLTRKLHTLSEGSGALDRAMGTLRRLSEELGSGGVAPTAAPVALASAGPSNLEALLGLAAMAAGPLSSLAISLLLMAYLLMQREDVRDRFLRLAGLNDIHRTTRALADATERVGRYLLMQMLLNAVFGVGMGAGLAVIGVPNAPLWGVLGFMLRFIPFLGAWIAAALPLMVAFVTGEGWTEPLLVLLLFAVVDGVVTHVLEPLIYGRSTGISPLALLVSSAVWTVLWGPIGLLLAPPITACLAILGRHVPTLGFLEILLGNGEALPAPLRFYQRFLAGDPEGAQQIAETRQEEQGTAATLRELVMPAALALAVDRAAGALGPAAADRIGDGLATLATSLAEEPAPSDDARAVRILPVAGAADRALVGLVTALAIEAGWHIAAPGEQAELAIVCASLPVSAARLRRVFAHAGREAAAIAGFAPEEPAALQLATGRPGSVSRSIEAIAARLEHPRRQVAAEAATAPPEGLPAPA
ncbi:AI-2E family transporter [Neoroseomonas oryzicola]|uniref:AI-2E family transporter n=1 Tax=Neoroseomonas oryzicola TaxID=535904 RepID=A0A9X9WC15_9PROT|nr:AI-2E family transporter [Neoroseomonas oryzicola]NKE18557.1 AI-2E family transporter [Neoroseomonas oryzicola]